MPASVKPLSRRVAKEGRVKEKETVARETAGSIDGDRAGQIMILAMPLPSFVVCRQFVRDIQRTAVAACTIASVLGRVVASLTLEKCSAVCYREPSRAETVGLR